MTPRRSCSSSFGNAKTTGSADALVVVTAPGLAPARHCRTTPPAALLLLTHGN